MLKLYSLLVPLALGVQVLSLNLMLTNDDGWATAQERAVFNTLDDAGYNVRFFHCSTLIYGAQY